MNKIVLSEEHTTDLQKLMAREKAAKATMQAAMEVHNNHQIDIQTTHATLWADILKEHGIDGNAHLGARFNEETGRFELELPEEEDEATE